MSRSNHTRGRGGKKAPPIEIGHPFGRLKVIGGREVERHGKYYYVYHLCVCECGTETRVLANDLRMGRTNSCGCKRAEVTSARRRIHGGAGTHLYRAYKNMRQRCLGARSCADYHNYGGRGITICDEWLDDFKAFEAWALANGYREGLSLDRRDPNGHYEASNCRWIPVECQSATRRVCIHITIFGETKTRKEWTRDPRSKVSEATFRLRINRGWEAERALTTPASARHSRNRSRPNKPRAPLVPRPGKDASDLR